MEQGEVSSLSLSSLIEGERPVSEGYPEGCRTGDTPETAMVLCTPLPDVLMSAVAEGRIRGHLAVAEFVVATLGHIEGYWTAPRQDPLALTVAKRVDLTMTTSAPIVRLAAGEVHVGREDAGVGGQTRRSVSAFLVRS